MNASGSKTIGISFFLVGLLAGAGLRHFMAARSPSIAVDALISGGNRFNLYYNEEWSEPVSLPVVAGQWHVYIFPVPPTIANLRFDPSDSSGSTIQIRSVSFHIGSKSIAIPLLDLIGWTTYNSDLKYDGAQSKILLTATGSNPYVMGALKQRMHAGLLSVPLNGKNLLWGCLLAGAICLLFQFFERDALWSLLYIPLIVLAVWAPILSTMLVPLLHLTATPPDNAISLPSYRGIAKSADLLTVLLAVLICAAVATLGMLVVRRLTNKTTLFLSNNQDSRRFPSLFVAAATLIFGLLSYPAFKTTCEYDAEVHHTFDQDTQVGTMWHYLAHKGLLPYRDFWYPYGGMYNKFVPLRQELINSFIHDLFVFTVVFASLYILLKRRKFLTAALCGGYVVFEASGILWSEASWRYLLSLSVLLLLGAALTALQASYFVALGLWTCYALSQEGAQALYALPGGTLLVLAIWLLESGGQQQSRLVRLLGLTAIAFTAAASVWIAVLAARHQLREWWHFMSTLQIQSQYFAWPVEIATWFQLPTNYDQFGVFLLLLLTALSIVHILRRTELEAAHLIPLALAVQTFVLMQKQILRPGMFRQIAAIPLLGLCIILIQNRLDCHVRVRALWNALTLTWITFVAGVLLCCFFLLSPASWRPLLSASQARIADIQGHLEYALDHSAEWDRAAAAYFAPSSLSLDDSNGELLKNEFRRVTGGDTRGIFALGDAAYWYLILDRPTPYYLNSFHQAPLDAQYNTVNWIAAHHPHYVLWNPSNNQMDGIPNAIRTPVLFTFIAREFVPQSHVVNFALLRRRNAGEKSDLNFWLEALGSTADLGHLPAISNARAASSGEALAWLLKAEIKSPVQGGIRQISLMLGSHPFTIQFVEEKEVTTYWVRLDRIAQVATAAGTGIEPTFLQVFDGSVRLSVHHSKILKDTVF